MLGLLLAAGLGGVGFVAARNFVKRRLRFVDVVHSPAAPIVAGIAATLVAVPATILPLIGAGTAIAFGVGVGSGVASGRNAKD